MAVTVNYSNLLIGGFFQTNTHEAGVQLLPDVLGLPGGGFVTAYNNGVANDGYIALDFFDADRNVIGTARFATGSMDSDADGQPKLTALANGNVLVVWDDENTAGGDGGPQASIFTAAGAVVAQDIDLFTPETSTAPTQVDVDALANGGFVVSYAEAGDIYYRAFDAAGAQVVGATPVNTVTTGAQADTQVTTLSDGAFAITWTDTDPADQVIKGRIFEANGTPRTGEFLCSPGTGDKTQSAIAATQDGGFAVVYTDTGWAEGGVTGAGISLNLVSAAGAVGATEHVNPINFPDESNPDVTVLANGFITVTFTYPYSGSDTDILGHVYDQTGTSIASHFAIAHGNQHEVAGAVSALADGQFVTSWQDETADTDQGSIYSRVMEITRGAFGDASADSFTGDELRDGIFGQDGNDTLNGRGAADTIDGGAQADLIDGGGAKDLLFGGQGADTIHGGGGDDRIYGVSLSPIPSSDGDALYGDAGDDRLTAAGGGDIADGGAGDDNVDGGAGDDQLAGGGDLDKIRGQAGADTLEGGAGIDTLNGGVGDDVLYAASAADIDGSGDGDALNGANGHDGLFGSAGSDVLVGLGQRDTLDGRDGADTLDGGSSKDRLTGGLGADELTGGGGKDVFVYLDVLDSAGGVEDLLTDLSSQDTVDLSGIDADVTDAGDQGFVLVGAFSGAAAELVVEYHATGGYAGLTTIQGDVDGDGLADFVITVAGDRHAFDTFVL